MVKYLIVNIVNRMLVNVCEKCQRLNEMNTLECRKCSSSCVAKEAEHDVSKCNNCNSYF